MSILLFFSFILLLLLLFWKAVIVSMSLPRLIESGHRFRNIDKMSIFPPSRWPKRSSSRFACLYGPTTESDKISIFPSVPNSMVDTFWCFALVSIICRFYSHCANSRLLLTLDDCSLTRNDCSRWTMSFFLLQSKFTTKLGVKSRNSEIFTPDFQLFLSIKWNCLKGRGAAPQEHIKDNKYTSANLFLYLCSQYT